MKTIYGGNDPGLPSATIAPESVPIESYETGVKPGPIMAHRLALVSGLRRVRVQLDCDQLNTIQLSRTDLQAARWLSAGGSHLLLG
jgi:hypothetical protein